MGLRVSAREGRIGWNSFRIGQEQNFKNSPKSFSPQDKTRFWGRQIFQSHLSQNGLFDQDFLFC